MGFAWWCWPWRRGRGAGGVVHGVEGGVLVVLSWRRGRGAGGGVFDMALLSH